MYFLKCLNCTPENWQPIDHEQLCIEIQAAGYPADEMIDLIVIDPKVTIKTRTASYRKYVPAQTKDWAVRS